MAGQLTVGELIDRLRLASPTTPVEFEVPRDDDTRGGDLVQVWSVRETWFNSRDNRVVILSSDDPGEGES